MSAAAILVVDDEPAVRQILSRLLNDESWRTIVARDAEEGLRLLGQRRFDLLLTDFNMPGRDGLEFARLARRSHPELDIILMTAEPSLDNAIGSVQEGLYDFLTKPLSPESLKLALGRWRTAWETRSQLADTQKLLDSALDELMRSLDELTQTLPPGRAREASELILDRARQLSKAASALRPRLQRAPK